MTKINSICIIDDDPIVVFGMRKMLDSFLRYANLYTYGNGKLALEGIQQLIHENEDLPDVIFLDLNMPIMDGWQFLEEFITLPITTKIRINIVTSSIDSADYKAWESYKAKTHHTLTYNRKPIRRAELIEITKATLHI